MTSRVASRPRAAAKATGLILLGLLAGPVLLMVLFYVFEPVTVPPSWDESGFSAALPPLVIAAIGTALILRGYRALGISVMVGTASWVAFVLWSWARSPLIT